jgi:hypothetical protein
MFNVVHFYIYIKYLDLNGSDKDLHEGPRHPSIYKGWIDDKYNAASWYISYFIYEKRNNLEPVFNKIFK